MFLQFLQDYKSKLGMFLASVYILFFICLFVAIITIQSPNSTAGLALFFGTLPGSLLPLIIFSFFTFYLLGISELNTDFFGYVCIFLGAAINSWILYFLGYLFTAMFIALRDAIRNVLSRRSRN